MDTQKGNALVLFVVGICLIILIVGIMNVNGSTGISNGYNNIADCLFTAICK